MHACPFFESKVKILNHALHAQVIKQQYCYAREVGKDGRTVPARLSATALDEQAGAYIRACLDIAPTLIMRRKIALASVAASQATASNSSGSTSGDTSSKVRTLSPTSKMWQSFSATQKCSDVFPEYEKLAELVLVMVGGSVEKEDILLPGLHQELSAKQTWDWVSEHLPAPIHSEVQAH